jgi:hypothetical protein
MNIAGRWRHLRRCISFAAGRTRWFSFTRDVLPAAVAAAGTALATYYVNSGLPQPQSSRWWLPYVVGVLALLVFWLLFNSIPFVWFAIRATSVLRREDERSLQAVLLADSTDASAKTWWKTALATRDLGVVFAACFGSAVQQHKTRDIDVVIVVDGDGASNNVIRRRVLGIKRLGASFNRSSPVPSHLQVFSTQETSRARAFVDGLGAIDILIGAAWWERISGRNT